MRRTKIIATLGPASQDGPTLEAMISAGVDLVRINAAHGDRDLIERLARAARSAAGRVGRDVGVLLDLAGPKIRIGRFRGGSITLAEGDRLVLELNEQLVTSFDGPVRSNLTTLLHEMHWSEHVFWDCVGSLEKFVRQLAMEVTRRRYLGEGLCRACYGYRVPLEWVQAMGVQPPQDASKNAEPAPTAEGLASAHWRTMPLSPQQVLQAWAYPDASVSDGVRRGWRLQYRYWNNIGWLEWIDELRVLDNALQQTHAKLTCNQTQQTHRNLI
jgi:hypothetical protein